MSGKFFFLTPRLTKNTNNTNQQTGLVLIVTKTGCQFPALMCLQPNFLNSLNTWTGQLLIKVFSEM